VNTNASGARPDDAKEKLSLHIEETVHAVAQLHADHHRNSTFSERMAERATALLGRSSFLIFLGGFILLWILSNSMLSRTGHIAPDMPPFPWLQDALTLLSVCMGVLILTTQRRADQLADLREQITLELASLTEQKVAKIIELIEELRRDSPQVTDRVDNEAQAMAERAGPHAMLGAIKESHEAILTNPDTGARLSEARHEAGEDGSSVAAAVAQDIKSCEEM
jgi:uncharacterized membrane protein